MLRPEASECERDEVWKFVGLCPSMWQVNYKDIRELLEILWLSHTHTHTHTHTRTQTRTRIHTHIHAHTHAHTQAHTHSHTHTQAHTHTCIHTHMHTHTRTCTHTHTHMHTHIFLTYFSHSTSRVFSHILHRIFNSKFLMLHYFGFNLQIQIFNKSDLSSSRWINPNLPNAFQTQWFARFQFLI